jgi:hypothetical protein
MEEIKESKLAELAKKKFGVDKATQSIIFGWISQAYVEVTGTTPLLNRPVE